MKETIRTITMPDGLVICEYFESGAYKYQCYRPNRGLMGPSGFGPTVDDAIADWRQRSDPNVIVGK